MPSLKQLAQPKGINIGAFCQPFGNDLLPQAQEMVVREYSAGTLGWNSSKVFPGPRQANFTANAYHQKWLSTLEAAGMDIMFHRLFSSASWMDNMSAHQLREEIIWRLEQVAGYLDAHPNIKRVLLFNEECLGRPVHEKGWRQNNFQTKLGSNAEGLVWAFKEARQRWPSRVRIGYGDFTFEWWAARWVRENKWGAISDMIERCDGACDLLMAQGHLTGETKNKVDQLASAEVNAWCQARGIEYVIGEHDVFTDSYQECAASTSQYLKQCLEAGITQFYTWELCNQTSWVAGAANIPGAKPTLFDRVGSKPNYRFEPTPAYHAAAGVLAAFLPDPNPDPDPDPDPDPNPDPDPDPNPNPLPTYDDLVAAVTAFTDWAESVDQTLAALKAQIEAVDGGAASGRLAAVEQSIQALSLKLSAAQQHLRAAGGG